MAAVKHGNIWLCDAAESLWTKTPTKVRLIQWVDDNGDIIHDSTLVLTLNGVALTMKVQPVNDELGFGAVVWEAGPFNPGVEIHSFVITTMGTGRLHVWID